MGPTPAQYFYNALDTWVWHPLTNMFRFHWTKLLIIDPIFSVRVSLVVAQGARKGIHRAPPVRSAKVEYQRE